MERKNPFPISKKNFFPFLSNINIIFYIFFRIRKNFPLLPAQSENYRFSWSKKTILILDDI